MFVLHYVIEHRSFITRIITINDQFDFTIMPFHQQTSKIYFGKLFMLVPLQIKQT
jgi:hypothetical protein